MWLLRWRLRSCGSAYQCRQSSKRRHRGNLRTRIGALIEDGGDIMDAPKIDQQAWSYLEQFDSLAGRNAQTTYEQMEWE